MTRRQPSMWRASDARCSGWGPTNRPPSSKRRLTSGGTLSKFAYMMLETHPLAELIPAMTDAEYQELRDDIAAHGLRESITLHEDKILDGRHRAQACAELGIEPKTRKLNGSDGAPAAFVLSKNIHRRNLSPSQRAATVVQFLPELKAAAKARQGERTDLELSTLQRGKFESPAVEPKPTSGSAKVTRESRYQAGTLAGVSRDTVMRAEKVHDEDPELFEQIKTGKKSALAAYNQVQRATKPPPAPAVEMTARQRQLAAKARQRMERAVGTCNGLARGLDELKVEQAAAVATATEIQGWGGAFRDATTAINRLRKRLEAR